MNIKFLFLSALINLFIARSYSQIFSEDFENSGTIPAGWTNELDNEHDWEFVDSIRFDSYLINNDHTSGSGYFATYYLESYIGEYLEGKLSSPTIDLTSSSNPTLSFYWNNPKGISSVYRLRVNIYANGTWNTDVIPNLFIKTYGWKKITLNLADYKYNDVIIQFRMNYNTYCIQGIDDVTIYEDHYDWDSKFLESQIGQIAGDTINHIHYLNSDNYLEVLNLDIADTDTLDNIPTIITKATFKKIPSTNMNLSTRIIDADIYKDGICVNKAGLNVGYDYLTFQFNDEEFIVNDTSQLTLKIAFDTLMWDYSSCSFYVDSINHGWETADSSSHFPDTIKNGLIEGNVFLTAVEATRLDITSENQEGSFIGDTLEFFIVKAVDEFGNRDIDYDDNITLLNSLNIPMIGNTEEMIDGEVYFRYLAFTENGIEALLSTSNTKSLLNDISSTSITIFDQTIFEDDFESDEGWTLTGEFQIGLPNNPMGGGIAWGAYSGIKALTLDSIDNYNSNVQLYDEVAISPIIDASGNYAKIGIWFKSWSTFIGFGDNGSIDFSIDGGNNWNDVNTAYEEWQGRWVNEIYVLNDVAISDQLLVRFSYQSDTEFEQDGWNIDDFKIVGILNVSAENFILATTIGNLNATVIENIPFGTIVSDLLSALTISDNATATILESSGGNEVANLESTRVNGDMVILVTAENEDTREYSLSIMFSTQIGITDRTDNHISIYPIPAKDIINFELLDHVGAEIVIELIDINGQVKIAKTISGENTIQEFDVTSLSSGFYYLRVRSENVYRMYKVSIL